MVIKVLVFRFMIVWERKATAMFADGEVSCILDSRFIFPFGFTCIIIWIPYLPFTKFQYSDYNFYSLLEPRGEVLNRYYF